jgi:tetratricopeptide (TPR) repeat protein
MAANEAGDGMSQHAAEQDGPGDALTSLIDGGLELSRAGHHAEAVQRFQQAVTLAPDSHDAWVLLSDELCVTDDYVGAAVAADHALAIEATCDAWISKAAALDGLGRLEESVAALNQASGLDPHNPHVHFNIGQALARQHNAQGALTAFDYALSLDSTFAMALAGKAAALMALNRLPEARFTADRALEMDPGIALAWQVKATTLASEGSFAAAEQAINQALAIEPNDSECLALKGAIVGDLGRHGEARQLWQRALQVDPHNDLARDWLNQSLQDRNQRIAGAAVSGGRGCLAVLADVLVAFVKAIFR